MPDLEVPTPSLIASPSGSHYSLSERINIATRPIHSQLNKLIIARLPLALPPYTTNPSTYVSGLLYIAPIYTTFESLWQTILDTPRLPATLLFDACQPGQPLIDSHSVLILPNVDSPPLIHTPKVCSRTHSLLAHLRLPGLLRAGRLRADIRVLTRTSEHKIHEQLEAASAHGRLAAFLAHTTKSVDANPHVLLAYAWVLYMALFSGGRYLRASLKEAGGSGPDFWTRDPSPIRLTRSRRSSLSLSSPPRSERRKSRSESTLSTAVRGMQFFNFPGDEDGEDIKLEFKKRITEAEVLLTNREKEEIIAEAQRIFKGMVELVSELDAVMGEGKGLVGARDSVVVTQERPVRRPPTTTTEPERGWKGSLRGAIACAGRIVHFQGPFPTFKGTVVTHRSGDGLFEKEEKIAELDVKKRKADAPAEVLRGLMTFVPLLTLFVMFCAWFHLR